jgi:predicted kinase
LRFIDIANDLAFLAMDFDFEGKRELGNLLLRNAARAFRDPEMLKVSDFYKCYRAFVRGKVESIQAISTEATKPEEHAKQAARYFRLALRYATGGSEPLVLIVMGRVGTGKTTVARQLASELGWPILSSDQIRKTLAGVTLTERTPPERRDEVYSARMTEQTYQELFRQGLAVLETHAGVILDATFSRRADREFLREASRNVRLEVLEVDADNTRIEERLRAREQSVGEISDARLEDVEKLNAAYEPPLELAPHLIKISTSNAVPDTVKAVLLQLTQKQLH